LACGRNSKTGTKYGTAAPMNRTVVSLFGVEPFKVGGIEMFARELSCQLAERGWKSVVCFLGPPSEQVRRYLDVPSIALEVLPNPLLFGWFGWQSIRSLSTILSRYRPEIVHFQFTPFLSPYPWLARLHSARRVYFSDQHSRPAPYVACRAALWKRAVSNSINFPMTAVISVSDFNRRCLTATGLLACERIRTLYNAVDLCRANTDAQAGKAFRRKHSIPLDCPLVVQVGWIIPEKGFPDLLEVARLVLAHDPDVHFAFVGESAYRNEYMQRTREMGLQDRVIWTGLVVDPLAEGVYRAADVICQLSRWQEAFGWTIAEAMAFNRPLVATRVGGIPELVKEGETGFLVTPGDVVSTAERILELLGDRDLRERMGAAGRKAVEANFNLKINVAKLLQFYGIC